MKQSLSFLMSCRAPCFGTWGTEGGPDSLSGISSRAAKCCDSWAGGVKPRGWRMFFACSSVEDNCEYSGMSNFQEETQLLNHFESV